GADAERQPFSSRVTSFLQCRKRRDWHFATLAAAHRHVGYWQSRHQAGFMSRTLALLLGSPQNQIPLLEPRIDGERAFERRLRLVDLALLVENDAFAGERGVVKRLERENARNRGERLVVFAGEEIDVAKLVPAF